MKILHTVESYLPSANGMSEVASQISEHLVALDHEVTVVTGKNQRRDRVINGVNVFEFDISGNEARGYRGDIDSYQNFILNSNFDIMTNFAAQQWATDLVLPLLDNIKAKKVFVPTGFSALFDPQYHQYFENMKSWFHKYDMNVFLSDDYRDIKFARENNVNNTIIIPNGADEKEFLRKSKTNIRNILGLPENCFLILHVGSHTGVKGHREAIQIFQKANIPNSCLLIIGNARTKCLYECIINSTINNLKSRKQPIKIKNYSRDLTIAAYQQADIFLFPSNIECSPIVLFEAAASKTPFLATDVGNSKEIADWLQSGLILPTSKDDKNYSFAKVDESAKILKDLSINKNQRLKMSKAGFNNWKSNYTWAKISDRYEHLYKSLLK